MEAFSYLGSLFADDHSLCQVVKKQATNQSTKQTNRKTKLTSKADKILNSFKMYIADKTTGLITEGTPYILLFTMHLPG